MLLVAFALLGLGTVLLERPQTAVASDPGVDWTARTSPADNDWFSVTHGNGIFVAVASSGAGNRVMTSPDGVDWTLRATPADNFWTSVTFGNGLFVAVAAFGPEDLVMTSPDGINWTLRTAADDSNWNSVTFGNGLFVAVADVGSGDQVMTSPDGINWTSRASAASLTWRSVTFGDGLFVAVASNGTGNGVMTSPDGITWTSRVSAADNAWFSVTHGNGLFVAVSVNGTGNRVMTSPDGVDWTIRASAADNGWRAVTFGNDLFVAVSGSGTDNRVMTSPDGITWTIRTTGAEKTWNSVVSGNGIFVAVAFFGDGNRVMTSGPVPEVLDVETEGNGSGTVTSDPAAIDCGPVSVACERGFPAESIVTLTAAPEPGSVFAGWSGACSGTGPCQVTMDEAKLVSADFQVGIGLIVIPSGNGSGTVTSNPAGIDCGTTCSEIFLEDSEVSLTAIPDQGSIFTGWSGACSGTGSCQVTMSEARAVTAGFTPEFDLTVSRTGNGTGAVASTPAGINCGLTCEAAFPENAVVTLAATPGEGSVFAGWSGACSGTGSCQVTMSEARAVTAGFTPEFELNVSRTGNGSGTVASTPAGIDCGVDCSEVFLENVVVTLAATPGQNSVFAGWSGACTGTGSCQVTMSEARSVQAEFTPEFTLSVSRSGDGSGTVTSSPAGVDCGVTCSATYLQNTVVTLTAAPTESSDFTGFTGACSGVSPCQVTMSEARTVGAEFTRRVTPPPPDPASFTRVILAPKKKKLMAGKGLKMTVSVTNSGGLAGTATVKITSSNKRKLKAPKTVKLQVPAGRTVRKSFTVRAVKRQKGKVTVTARLAGKSARSVVTLRR